MPSLKAIRTRIASVKNTQKITKAMKLVSAARLRRAQDAMTAARPYAKRLAEVIADISARGKAAGDEASHPLLTQRPVQRTRIIVVGSDRGLAGGYNSNLNRKVERFIVDEQPKLGSVDLVVVGRKAREHFNRRKAKVVGDHPAATGETVDALSHKLAEDATAAFLSTEDANRVDAVYVAFNEFQSAISQVPTIIQVLPVPAPVAEEKPGLKLVDASQLDFEYEPSKEAVLATALPLYLQVSIRRMLLDAVASEFGARMSAMDNATKNAKEMISSLTLVFNRARQAAITKELMEIVGGAEALKG
jgi:F-type H+-transporting ATPase subunit gamma